MNNEHTNTSTTNGRAVQEDDDVTREVDQEQCEDQDQQPSAPAVAEYPYGDGPHPPQPEGGLRYYTKFCWTRLLQFYNENDFVCMIAVSICLAKLYPPLGAEYLAPEITATWIAVIFIFLVTGLGLKTAELAKAFQRLKFNLFVQIFNFGVVSALIYGICRGLEEANVVSTALSQGMIVCATLPATINMQLVLTKSAGGDEAAAVFNAAFGNMVGVFLTPLLILGYLGVSGDVALGEVFYKLAIRVVTPVIVGQILQKFSPAAVEFNRTHKKEVKLAQQLTLVFIVYTVFCRTFAEENDSDLADVFLVIVIQFVQLLICMVLAWSALAVAFKDKPKLRVMGLFGCTHKSVATGIPLINAMYEGDPNVGLYTLPLLIWHPMQLVVGSSLTPKLYKWVEAEQERLGIRSEDDEVNDIAATELDEENAGDDEVEMTKTERQDTVDTSAHPSTTGSSAHA
eukprot:Nitzschia sp. Nitz4//scaffold50_size126154//8693//10152//NITZ4_003667-RA/size126154-processed-gene-0.27-mRNA-1//1//CDS//3329553644//6348//frame0